MEPSGELLGSWMNGLGDSCLGFDFPTRLHGRAFEVIDDDLAEQPGKVRARLKKRGAAFKGTKKGQIACVC
jgi:hypothetical protein